MLIVFRLVAARAGISSEASLPFFLSHIIESAFFAMTLIIKEILHSVAVTCNHCFLRVDWSTWFHDRPVYIWSDDPCFSQVRFEIFLQVPLTTKNFIIIGSLHRSSGFVHQKAIHLHCSWSDKNVISSLPEKTAELGAKRYCL